MKFNINYLIIITSCILVLVFFSCKKTDPGSPNIVNTDPEQYGTPFQNVPKTSDIVMYEININAFSASGDFYNITSRLDSIKLLGINTIWLMPIYPVGKLNSIGSPYCVMDYTSVNPVYGTLDDLRNLVTKAHERNITVILDWVANHTSWDNAWIKNKAWYTQDGNGNIISPAGTNWSDVADLNFDNMDMRLAMIKAMKYWTLAANIDGFRCDAADFVPYDFWKQAIDSLQNMKGRSFILLAEGSRTDHFTAGFQMNYAWSFLSTLKNVFKNSLSADQVFVANASEYNGLSASKRKLRFTTNHDESGNETPVSVFNGKDGALAASVIAFCLEGTPLLYCGQEVGVSNKLMYSSQRPINWTLNPQMLITYKQLFSFYNSSTALRLGELKAYNDVDVVAFTKMNLGKTVFILVNTRNRKVTYNLPQDLKLNQWINVMSKTSITLNESVQLEPYQFYILEK